MPSWICAAHCDHTGGCQRRPRVGKNPTSTPFRLSRPLSPHGRPSLVRPQGLPAYSGPLAIHNTARAPSDPGGRRLARAIRLPCNLELSALLKRVPRRRQHSVLSRNSTLNSAVLYKCADGDGHSNLTLCLHALQVKVPSKSYDLTRPSLTRPPTHFREKAILSQHCVCLSLSLSLCPSCDGENFSK